MALRISGINLPENKNLVIALTNIYGIGQNSGRTILKAVGIAEDVIVKDLTSSEENKLREYIESNLKVEGELKRETMMNIKHLKDINTYRGGRHSKNLPARGQRTKTNSRTVRGNVRKTAGSGRKSASEKT